MVAWDADSDDTGYGIRFSVSTPPQPAGHRVAPSRACGCQDRDNVAACRDAAGGAVVVWEEDSFDGSDEAIIGQRYDSSGGEVGARFQVNSYTLVRSVHTRRRLCGWR